MNTDTARVIKFNQNTLNFASQANTVQAATTAANIGSSAAVSGAGATAATGAAGAVKIEAGAAGKVVKIAAAAGTAVKKGDPVVVLEVMKMETPVVAPQDGTVASINCNEGQQVDAGALLATMN